MYGIYDDDLCLCVYSDLYKAIVGAVTMFLDLCTDGIPAGHTITVRDKDKRVIVTIEYADIQKFRL